MKPPEFLDVYKWFYFPDHGFSQIIETGFTLNRFKQYRLLKPIEEYIYE